MSDLARGFVLLVSLLLWLPVLRLLLAGQMGAAEAVLRYGGAFLLAWAGIALLSAIVSAYTPQDAPADAVGDEGDRGLPTSDDATPSRRQSDVSS